MTEPIAPRTVVVGRSTGPARAPAAPFPAPDWEIRRAFVDIRYEVAEGIAKITICRPEVRNAFRPQTLFELAEAFELAHDDPRSAWSS